MLFNSHVFIFLFLPITLFVFFKIGRMGYSRLAIAWLIGASLFFYGWWNPAYMILIIGSVLFNYTMGVLIVNQSKKYLALGIIVNLFLLGYFKYANFFIANINVLTGKTFHLGEIFLPLGISFFTFQQIAYLIDTYRGKTHKYDFLHYSLFVTFFPQLIAGPIVHHREMLPQFAEKSSLRFNAENMAVGLTIFFIGLFKKVVLADGVAVYASPVFDAALNGFTLTFFEAWGGALAYTFQLYFDFSGYSDMAIGLGRMFGIRLPLNFHSPYKAVNIIDFWRRWHITLSRFLRDYLYIPLGGNRKGPLRRGINLMITMLLGGLWHGAGWTFVIWGGLHGVYMLINHAWQGFRRLLGQDIKKSSFVGRLASMTLTFTAVVVAWVFFRAKSFDSALSILQSMIGLNGFALPETYLGYLNRLFSLGTRLAELGWQFERIEFFKGIREIASLGFLLLLVWFAPNTQQLMARYRPAFDTYKGKSESSCWQWMQWQPRRRWAIVCSVVTLLAILGLTRVSEFLYFQF